MLIDHVEQTYHLLSEIDPKKGLEVRENLDNKPAFIPFSHATQTALARLKTFLGGHSNEITPRFTQDGGHAVLNTIEMNAGQEHSVAARKIASITQLKTPHVTTLDEDQTAKLVYNLPVPGHVRAS